MLTYCNFLLNLIPFTGESKEYAASIIEILSSRLTGLDPEVIF